MTVPSVTAPGPAGARAQVRSAADLLHDARARERAGGLPGAAAGYETVISAAERTGERAVLAEALRRLAVVRLRCNQSGEARLLCNRSFTVAREAGNDILAAEALNTLGGIELEAGPLAEARSHFLRAVALDGASRELRARVEQNLGILASIQGDFEGALACYARSLEAYQTCGDEHGCAIAYHNLGMVSAQRQLLDEADRYFTRSYEIAVRVDDVYLQGLCLLNHAEVYFARERYEEARRNAESALGLFDQVDGGVLRAQAYRIIGMVYRETGRPALAEARLRSAIELAVAAGSALNEATARREVAILYQAMGRNHDALVLLNEAHALFGRLDARGDLVYVDGKMAELEATYLALVSEWGQSIESNDTYTYGHCERVARQAVAVARALGLDEHAQTTIRLGAYLHDVGKVRVLHEVLNKPGPLTHDELEVMQMHPIWGVELLGTVEFPWDLKPVIRWHHEKYDGTGYPDRLRGDEIPLAAQIVGIADVYDALTTTRSYRPAMEREAALAEIERCRAWWSEAVYLAFREALAAPALDNPGQCVLGSPLAS
ncbi:MAG TPA: tetratricopeptide repeat protein [Gemmatimonadales bacterium]|nr:tetratricopeptide repeat protein [Gemmatimonadales bacterium]